MQVVDFLIAWRRHITGYKTIREIQLEAAKTARIMACKRFVVQMKTRPQ
jgi:hypothetical protein